MQNQILYILLLLTPLFSIQEIITLFIAEFDTELSLLVATKILKDILIISMIIIGVINFKKINILISLESIFFIILILLFSIINSLESMPLIALLAGLRWLFPFIFFLTFIKSDEKLYLNISNILQILLYFGVFLQIIELFYMNGIYDLTESVTCPLLPYHSLVGSPG